ncbi:unnamed protein product [Ambrosiozyma monospora]|uniref:Unnamed protein product n=1 Tax=Ambrosiozyma monospora TaxID=43982 RepID=A0A9W7DJP9_AMBMO|nr:unnamed protein product [Ambrosiozyma monospora]
MATLQRLISSSIYRASRPCLTIRLPLFVRRYSTPLPTSSQNTSIQYSQESNVLRHFLSYADRNTSTSPTDFFFKLLDPPPLPDVLSRYTNNGNSKDLINSNPRQSETPKPLPSDETIPIQQLLSDNGNDINITISSFVNLEKREMFKCLNMDNLLDYIVETLQEQEQEQLMGTLGLSFQSYTYLMYYASKYGTTMQVARIFRTMVIQDGMIPSIDIFNCIFLGNHSPGLWEQLLKIIRVMDVKVDCNTWYLMFISLQDSTLKDILLTYMMKNRINVHPITPFILKWRLEIGDGSHQKAVFWMINKKLVFSNEFNGYLNQVILDTFIKLPLAKMAINDGQHKHRSKYSVNRYSVEASNDVYKLQPRDDVNEFISKMIHSSGGSRQSVLKKIDILRTQIIPNHAEELNQESWESIIYLHCITYRFGSVQKFISNFNISMTTAIMRDLMKYSLSATLPRSKLEVFQILCQLKHMPTLTTNFDIWQSIMTKFSDDPEKQLQLVEILKLFNVHTPRMQQYALMAKYKLVCDATKVAEWFIENEVGQEDYITSVGMDFLIDQCVAEKNEVAVYNLLNSQMKPLYPTAVKLMLTYFTKQDKLIRGRVFLDLLSQKHHPSFKFSYSDYEFFDEIMLVDLKTCVEEANKERLYLVDQLDEFKDDIPEKQVVEVFSKLVENGLVKNDDLYTTMIAPKKLTYLNQTLFKYRFDRDPNDVIESMLRDPRGGYSSREKSLIFKYVTKLPLSSITATSRSMIIRFLAQGQAKRMLDYINAMLAENLYPSREDLNYVLFLLFNSKISTHKNKAGVWVLDHFSRIGHSPDTTTCYLLYAGLESKYLHQAMERLVAAQLVAFDTSKCI